MKKMNVIVVFDKNLEKTLMCKRTKEPYIGMYNLVGGKIEKENDGLNEAYRELEEETNIRCFLWISIFWISFYWGCK